ANSRQRVGKGKQPLVLRGVPYLAPAPVIQVLLTATVIAPGCLDVAVAAGADPDVGPRGRDDQVPDPQERFPVRDRFTARVDVLEALAGSQPPYAGLVIAHIPQASKL